MGPLLLLRARGARATWPAEHRFGFAERAGRLGSLQLCVEVRSGVGLLDDAKAFAPHLCHVAKLAHEPGADNAHGGRQRGHELRLLGDADDLVQQHPGLLNLPQLQLGAHEQAARHERGWVRRPGMPPLYDDCPTRKGLDGLEITHFARQDGHGGQNVQSVRVLIGMVLAIVAFQQTQCALQHLDPLPDRPIAVPEAEGHQDTGHPRRVWPTLVLVMLIQQALNLRDGLGRGLGVPLGVLENGTHALVYHDPDGKHLGHVYGLTCNVEWRVLQAPVHLRGSLYALLRLFELHQAQVVSCHGLQHAGDGHVPGTVPSLHVLQREREQAQGCGAHVRRSARWTCHIDADVLLLLLLGIAQEALHVHPARAASARAGRHEVLSVAAVQAVPADLPLTQSGRRTLCRGGCPADANPRRGGGAADVKVWLAGAGSGVEQGLL
mmetsp:Transcript_20017/g.56524  ORF Transcript_20017/g.56524 Transcript_20017/m.56524 type:complete len:437 (+) Transcript_20017:1494-2804(+)